MVDNIEKRLHKIFDTMDTIENYLFMEDFTEREKLLMLKIIYQVHLNAEPNPELLEKEIQEIINSLNFSDVITVTKVIEK